MDQVERRCAVLGDPIDHSLSPILHRAAYGAMGLDGWEYDRHRVTQETLDGFIASLDPSWAGLSLTMPLKKTIGPMGAFCDLWARILGVSNTAVLTWDQSRHRGGRPAISLTNTDVEGIVCALMEVAGSLTEPDQAIEIIKAVAEGQPVAHSLVHLHGLILGSGNTAESALCALGLLGVDQVELVARHPERTSRMIDLAGELGITVGPPHGMDEGNLVADLLCRADLVVSTLPAHAADPMADLLDGRTTGTDRQPQDESSPADAKPGHLLLDVVYQPRPTRLIQSWKRRTGGRAASGDRMLLYQAVRQVAQMTCNPLDTIPVGAMDRALKKEMQ